MFDFLKTRKRLINERDRAWLMLDVLRSSISATTTETLEKLQDLVEQGKDQDPPRVMPGSDIGLGQLNIQHWGIACIAESFKNMFDDIEGAKNFITMTFSDKIGNIYEVTLRKNNGKSPADEIAELKEEIKRLTKE